MANKDFANTYTEFKTRIERINVALEESGWKVKSRGMVIEELDTKQSNFKKRNGKNKTRGK